MASLSTALYEVLYVSQLAPGMQPGVVAEIAGPTRIANAALDITGVLIFDGQRFCQQLEGPRKAVLKLVERIRNDARHVAMEVVHHGPLQDRRFRQFSLAFSTLEDVDALARLEALDGRAALDAFSAVCRDLEF
ncbi:MAG: BLUF domain-containing protein [Acidovorax sp.]|uniref:BLUF domain-containing protein n=1 Tax=Acidovorax sp. TaxID=1872122 RepID=UPI0039E2DB99